MRSGKSLGSNVLRAWEKQSARKGARFMPEYYRHSSVNGWKYVWIKKYMGTDIAMKKGYVKSGYMQLFSFSHFLRTSNMEDSIQNVSGWKILRFSYYSGY